MKTIIIIAAVILLCTGCVFEQFWPTEQASPVIVGYNNKDPNDFNLPISTLGNLKKLQKETEKTHLDNQTYWKARLAVDEGTYGLAKSELEIKITTAEQQFQTYVGSPQSPGILWGLLYAGGGATGMMAALRKMWYTEAEHQQKVAEEVEKATNGNKTTSTI
jgi:hypothetical protein